MFSQLKYIITIGLFCCLSEVFSQENSGPWTVECWSISQGDSLHFSQKPYGPSLTNLNPCLEFSWLDDQSIRIQSSNCSSDTVCFRFLALPDSLFGPLRLRSTQLIQSNKLSSVGNGQPSSVGSSGSFLGGLNASGNIRRGLRSGTKQSLSFDSGMELQFSGFLDEETEIRAVINDRNLPVQADGYTQQLQEFDQVYMQLLRKNQSYTAGDIIVEESQFPFARFRKKTSGLEANFQSDSSRTKHLGLGLGISRGLFHRQRFFGEEGNQGPYRLVGANQERFIIVLSGSERVYVDGILLTRGANNDYIIDYNSGEITFTPNQLMTKDKRVVVEFEYAARNFPRVIQSVSAAYSWNNMQLKLSRLGQYDLKNQSFQEALSPEQRALLQAAGDNPANRLQTAYDSLGFQPNSIRYRKTDSLGYDPVFVYSQNPDSAHWLVQFSYLGPGQGDYVFESTALNGQVYRWVAPVQGVSQGDYGPVLQVQTPESQELISSQLTYSNEQLEWQLDWSVSLRDSNTFSTLDDNDNAGQAIRFAALKKWNRWSIGPRLEYVSRNFQSLEPYRDVEFNRNFNLGNQSIVGQQWLAGLEAKHKGQEGLFHYIFDLRSFEYQGQAWQQSLQYAKNKAQQNHQGLLAHTQTKGANQSDFFRSQMQGKWQKEKWNWFYTAMSEYKSIIQSDSLVDGGFYFADAGVGLGRNDSVKQRHFQLKYAQRWDGITEEQAWQRLSEASTLEGKISIGQANSRIQLSSTYRNLNALNDSVQSQKSLVGRLAWNKSWSKGFLRWNGFFEAGAGREPQREFNYVEVAPGQGQFSWYDYNGNGIQELGEFESPPLMDTARFIRVFIPTRNYLPVNIEHWSQQLHWRPASLWSNSKGAKAWLSRFSSLSSWQLNRRNLQTWLINFQAFAPIDSNTLALNQSFDQKLWYRHGPWSVEYSLSRKNNQQALIYGKDGQAIDRDALEMNWRFNAQWNLQLGIEKGQQRHASEAFANRNFSLSQQAAKGQLRWAINQGQSLSAEVKWKQEEEAELMQSLNQWETQVKFLLQSEAAGRWMAGLGYINNDYQGDGFSALAFELLDGLLPGENITWSLLWEHVLSNNLQVSLNYDGRSAPNIPAIHTGSAQVKLFF